MQADGKLCLSLKPCDTGCEERALAGVIYYKSTLALPPAQDFYAPGSYVLARVHKVKDAGVHVYLSDDHTKVGAHPHAYTDK